VSEIGDRIDLLVRERLVPCLRSVGFKGSGRTYWRTFNDVIQVVNVQSSKWNLGSDGRFTINLGVFYPAVARLIDPERAPAKPKEYECTIRTRIGRALGSSQDLWWDVGQDTDIASLGGEVARLVMSAGVAWLEQNSSIEQALEALRSQPVPRAAALISIGRLQEAASVIESALAQGGRTEAYQRRWGIKHGLLEH
jgi:hypothetical protein